MFSFRYVVSGFLLSIISGFLIEAHAQTVNVTVSNIKSNQGQIIIAVFKDQQGFKDEKPVSRQKFPKSAITKGVLKVSLEVPAGTYGLALVDDENNSGKMEKNMLGIPKEGVGFSNFYLSGMSKPTFHDFKFEVKPPSVAVECKIRYF